MILEFKCSNFFSINEEVDFNFLATSDKKLPENIASFDGKNFIKSAEIYGPNDSGKSNVLNAIFVIKQMVCNSYKNGPNKSIKLPYNPHKLNNSEPTQFVMWFEKNNNKYYYEFSYVQEKVLEENLYFCDLSKSRKMITVFERDNNSFIAGANFIGEFGNCDKELKDKKLLLSVAANITNIVPVSEAFSFFDEDIIIWNNNDIDSWTEKTAKNFQDNINFNNMALTLLKKFCPKLESITAKVEKRTVSEHDLPQDLPDFFKDKLLEKGMTTLDIKFNYDKFQTSLSEESLGTRLVFNMLTPLIDVIQNNKVFICDEFETHLHPALAKELLRFFYSNKDSKSQFILSTHNLELLDKNMVRRDQIWFTKLDDDSRSTRLFSLAEYNGVRNDENLRKGYIEHRYGSWPDIELY